MSAKSQELHRHPAVAGIVGQPHLPHRALPQDLYEGQVGAKPQAWEEVGVHSA
jgi:hypothetical protein